MKRPSLILALLLQVLPLSRVGLISSSVMASPTAIALSWCAILAIMLGRPDAVSGASASVSGLVKYVDTTPVGGPTNYVVEPAGEVFKYRITVTNPGIDVGQNYFNCIPLPPGLTINTNLGAAGYITGTPTAIGSFPVTLLAGNLSFPTPSTLPATIVIYPPALLPVILDPPASQSVLVGGTATFSLTVQGSLPMAYQWLFNDVNLPGETAPALLLTNVTTAQAGGYRVIITNDFGATTSVVAHLTVREALVVDLKLSQASTVGNAFHCVITGPIYTNYIVWRSDDLSSWVPIRTNFVLDGYLDFTDPDTGASPLFYYRASVAR